MNTPEAARPTVTDEVSDQDIVDEASAYSTHPNPKNDGHFYQVQSEYLSFKDGAVWMRDKLMNANERDE